MRTTEVLLNLIEEFSYRALRLWCWIDNDAYDLLMEGAEQARDLLLLVHNIAVREIPVVCPSLFVAGAGESARLQLVAIIPCVA